MALGQALGWNNADAQEFWRDLELYEMLSSRETSRPVSTRRRIGSVRRSRGAAAGSFADGAGSARGREISARNRRGGRPRAAKSVFPAPRELKIVRWRDSGEWATSRQGISPGTVRRGGCPYKKCYGRASSTMLNGVSAALRTRVNPADFMIFERRPSPACAPRPSPTSCESDAGVHRKVDAP